MCPARKLALIFKTYHTLQQACEDQKIFASYLTACVYDNHMKYSKTLTLYGTLPNTAISLHRRFLEGSLCWSVL